LDGTQYIFTAIMHMLIMYWKYIYIGNISMLYNCILLLGILIEWVLKSETLKFWFMQDPCLGGGKPFLCFGDI